MVEGTLLRQSADVVVKTLVKSLGSLNRNVRYWSCNIAASFADPLLLPALVECLREHDSDMQCMAALALGCLQTEEATAALARAKVSTTRHRIA
jgi:hypothetical protein